MNAVDPSGYWSYSKRSIHWWGVKLHFTYNQANDIGNFLDKLVLGLITGGTVATAVVTAFTGPGGIGFACGWAIGVLPVNWLKTDVKYYLSSSKNPQKKGLVVELKWWLYGSKVYFW